MSRLQPHQLKALTAHEALVARGAANATDFVMPAPIPRKKRTYEESDNQVALFQWWATHCRSFGVAECLMFAIPNGSALGTGKEDWQVKERVIRGKRAKREGSRPGIPDIMLAAPSARPQSWQPKNHHGLFIEMKTANGKVSSEQEEAMGYLTARGYKCVVCRSCEEAITAIKSYLT